MGFGRTNGNNPNALPTPCVDNREQTARRTYTQRDESPLPRIGFIIRDRDRVRIIKNRNRLGHPDTVLAEVDSSFALFVPLETHDFSVRTLCAYVNQEAESAWSPRTKAGPVLHSTDLVPHKTAQAASGASAATMASGA